MKYRLHVLGIPHTITSPEYNACAFTMKVYKFCKMMSKRGHYIIHYGHEKSKVECDEKVTLIKAKEFYSGNFGKDKTSFFEHDASDKNHILFNKRGCIEVVKRVQKGDFVLCFWGSGHQAIADAAMATGKCIVIEPGIGYPASSFTNRVFESYAIMHNTYGAQNIIHPSWYHCVIPNYFDPEEFTFQKEKQDYFLFLGRICKIKGVDIAIDVTRRTGQKLIIAGQGKLEDLGFKEVPSHVEYVGYADIETRKKLMAGAKGFFLLPAYVEPFGGAALEAMFSGTPVITSDWGVFNETVLHGITGYRCRTMEQLEWATLNIDKIKPETCYNWARNNYGFNKIGPMYEEYFFQLAQLWKKGWYEPNPERTELDWMRPILPESDTYTVLELPVVGSASSIPGTQEFNSDLINSVIGIDITQISASASDSESSSTSSDSLSYSKSDKESDANAESQPKEQSQESEVESTGESETAPDTVPDNIIATLSNTSNTVADPINLAPPKIQYIEIGTSNFDTLIEEADNGIGISIEPVKYYLDNLPDRNGCIKLNLAISDHEGSVDVYYLPMDIIKQYKLPDWARGCNSINKPHPTVEKLLQKHELSETLIHKESVPVTTLGNVLREHNISMFDTLKIDTEGHDLVILRDFHKEGIYPWNLIFENNTLTDQLELKKILALYSNYRVVAQLGDELHLRRKDAPPRVAIFSRKQWAFGRIHTDLEEALEKDLHFAWFNWSNGTRVKALLVDGYWKLFDKILCNTVLVNGYLDDINHSLNKNKEFLQKLVIISHAPKFEVQYYTERVDAKNPMFLKYPTYGGVSRETVDNFQATYEITANYTPCGVNTRDFQIRPVNHPIRKVGFIGHNIENPIKNTKLFLEICAATELEPVFIHNREYTENSKLYEDIDMLICTSAWEGNPLGIFEAAACGIPILSTRVGNVRELKSAKMFETCEEATRLIQEINATPESLQQYIDAVTTEVRNEWNWNVIADKYWKNRFTS